VRILIFAGLALLALIVDVLFDNATVLGIGDTGRRLLVATRDQILDMLTGATTVEAVGAALSDFQRLVQSRGAWPEDGVNPTEDLAAAVSWFTWDSFPAFFALRADGTPAGRTLSSAAWGAGTPENIVPFVRGFVAQARA
jgi:hypothetical protein